ncbi:hypothetical protein TNCV_3386171 [Trichonephila clavipes]|nr:hypothetical protein TNCV_3386171 [Trichonephila clavipes]
MIDFVLIDWFTLSSKANYKVTNSSERQRYWVPQTFRGNSVQSLEAHKNARKTVPIRSMVSEKNMVYDDAPAHLRTSVHD